MGLAPETLRRTNLGDLKIGDGVNLERSLSPSSRMGGHFVQGIVNLPTPCALSLLVFHLGFSSSLSPLILVAVLYAGHVDGTGVVSNKVKDKESLRVTISASPQLLQYIVEKGNA